MLQMPKPHEGRCPPSLYESRYFSVTLKEDEPALHTDTGRIAAVKGTDICKKGSRFVEREGVSHYRYKKTEIEDENDDYFLTAAESHI